VAEHHPRNGADEPYPCIEIEERNTAIMSLGTKKKNKPRGDHEKKSKQNKKKKVEN